MSSTNIFTKSYFDSVKGCNNTTYTDYYKWESILTFSFCKKKNFNLQFHLKTFFSLPLCPAGLTVIPRSEMSKSPSKTGPLHRLKKVIRVLEFVMSSIFTWWAILLKLSKVYQWSENTKLTNYLPCFFNSVMKKVWTK